MYDEERNLKGENSDISREWIGHVTSTKAIRLKGHVTRNADMMSVSREKTGMKEKRGKEREKGKKSECIGKKGMYPYNLRYWQH